MFNGVVFFDEALTPSFLFGAALVLSGLVITIMACEARGVDDASPRIGKPAS
jgi:drug/metabolite transporter (DMT)-like permease